MNEVTKTPRTYRDGMCYGSGEVARSIVSTEVKRTTCPECRKDVGLNGGSFRIANHKPPDLAKQRRDATLKRMAARIQVQDWIQEERKRFDELDLHDHDELWMATAFIDRAIRNGLEDQRSRQELGKAIVVLMHVLERGVQEHGTMPRPGTYLTEILKDWER